MNPTRPGHRDRRGPRAATSASPAVRCRHLAGPGLLLIVVVLTGCGSGGTQAELAARQEPVAVVTTPEREPAGDRASADQAAATPGKLRGITPLSVGGAAAPVEPPPVTSDSRVTVRPKTTGEPGQGTGGKTKKPEATKSPAKGGGPVTPGKSATPRVTPPTADATNPAPATTRVTTPVPVTPSGSSGGWLLGGLALVLLVGGVAVGAVFVSRGRRAPRMEAWPPGVPTVQPSHSGGPASVASAWAAGSPASAPTGTAAPSWTAAPGGLGHLAGSLREVADGGVSEALAQQIDRLLASEPGRDALVEACIRFRDQLGERHPFLAARLLEALGTAGVHEIRADGQPFDGRVHEAVEVVPTADPRLRDVVASTERPGYVDGDRVVRVPRVAVYRLER
ncbi:nucleotide exchange factor GrpE [Planotetraspora mira]|uniref:Nucleotide exchange factor GrpE n=1 Tax=Planotetraspora mira TaxID=58121 RepID=A0A8J3TUT2_9ACTN|nr:nucleotide exchange factor GrpE [Planotetraspora mira]GII27615.1 hypothetical protein Pmi06nite_10570 [Planotetraspora mira]